MFCLIIRMLSWLLYYRRSIRKLMNEMIKSDFCYIKKFLNIDVKYLRVLLRLLNK